MGLRASHRSGIQARRLVIRTAALAALGAVAALLTAQTGSVLGAGWKPARQATNRAFESRAPAGQRSTGQQLTRWRLVGRWAHAVRAAAVHARPYANGRIVNRLHFRTEDGFPEVYLVLRRLVARNGSTWLKLALPIRPNGSTGWVRRGALGRLHRVRAWLVIDRTRFRMRFFQDNRALWNAPVGIGKPGTPTPEGLFWVREQFEVHDQPFYGPYAFGTSAYSNLSEWPGGGVVGLHGTSMPQLIPGRLSHGCVRLRNRDVLWLAYHMPVGTPISVVN
jgi:L,D-transpeptidase catalytic domain